MTVLGSQPPRFPIGLSDYAELRRGGYAYVDKTHLVAEVLEAPGKTKLLPRPRRFGKTLNLSMLRYFFERTEEERADLFEDTWVWTADSGAYRTQFQRYPVVWLTFKDIKGRTWEESWTDVRAVLRAELERLAGMHGLRELAGATGAESDWLTRADRADARPGDLKHLLGRLSAWLHEATGERAIIIVDEYDAPLHAAWEHGYWDDAIAFFRDFLSSGLKDATHLHRGVLTGILKVAKENIFSGLNNVETSSIFDPGSATHFGFTESEVVELARRAGETAALGAIRDWYNGYRFGGLVPRTLYNPWSVLQYLAKPSRGFQPFWKNTSSNALVRELLIRDAAHIGESVAGLLNGEPVTRVLDEHVPLNELNTRADAIWGLLTYSGYLTAEHTEATEDGLRVRLRIPNREVASIYRTTFHDWLQRAASTVSLDALTAAVLTGDAESFESALERILLQATSTHDFGSQPVEAVYRAFIIGLLVHLSASHRVLSNREAGHGRADVLVVPKDGTSPGAVLELKVVTQRETSERAMERALAQIRDRGYVEEVKAATAGDVFAYGVVFDGKRCWVERV